MFPHDLSAWVGRTTLAKFARAAAEIFYWADADATDTPPRHGCHCLRQKLALLTYCFASGLFSRCAIRGRMTADETMRQLDDDARFLDCDLNRFRSQNSESLKLTLAWVIQQAWESRCGVPRLLHNGSGWRKFVAAEAMRRLNNARLADRRIIPQSATGVSRFPAEARAWQEPIPQIDDRPRERRAGFLSPGHGAGARSRGEMAGLGKQLAGA